MMIHRRIADWDDAYANFPNVPRSERWPEAWVEPSRAYRERLAAEGRFDADIAYGDDPRQVFDLFRPASSPRGLAVFVHGGYWMRFDKSYWSHLAAGPVDRGYAVAMPSYRLCPAVPIGAITGDIAAALGKAAGLVDGPIHLAGHSAGGHLVSRMATATAGLPAAVAGRIAHVVSISGVHDLRPLTMTAMNETLAIDAATASAESPALLEPVPGTRLTCWVGASERAEFIRQSALLANVWTGLQAATALVIEPDRHHFDVIDGLGEADHPLTAALLTA